MTAKCPNSGFQLQARFHPAGSTATCSVCGALVTVTPDNKLPVHGWQPPVRRP